MLRRQKREEELDKLLEEKKERSKPPELTKTQWKKELSKKRREEREEEKQRDLDWNFAFHNSPKTMFIDMIEEVRCECEGEKIRAGKFCKTCILISKAREYTLNLFKDAAEGRSSYI